MMTKICSISKEINKNMVLSDLRRIKALVKMYDEYKIDKNIMVYLLLFKKFTILLFCSQR